MNKTQLLIVEDQLIVAKDIQNSLKRLGYEISAIAASGAEALQRAAELRPDLVLMDVVLPGALDGIEAAQRIREQFNIPVVFLTAYADDETVQRAKVTEPFGYIVKPFEERSLQTTIEMALYKHKLERELKQRVATTLNSIGDAVITTDTEGIVSYINPAAEALTGWQQTEALGQPLSHVLRLINEQTRMPAEIPLNYALHKASGIGSFDSILLISKSGTEIPIDDSAATIIDDHGQVTGLVLVFRDITKRKQAEAQLRQLSAHLETAREQERQHLARELHDQLGQELTALKIDLHFLRRRLQQHTSGSLEPEVFTDIDALLAQVDSSLDSMRGIVRQLRPERMTEMGLLAALAWQVEEFQHRSGIRSHFHSTIKRIDLPHEQAMALYRIVQESLTNVARHAEANEVFINFVQESDHWVLSVRDNGKGIGKPCPSGAQTFGILGMRERALMLGGSFDIGGSDGQGTAIQVRIPMQPSWSTPL